MMDSKEFYRIVKEEGLDKYNISDSKESRGMANVIGIAEDSNGLVVFETDERAQYRVISRHSSEGECLEALLNELRDKKRVEEIMKKIEKNCAEGVVVNTQELRSKLQEKCVPENM